jgi:hypothetical protein
MRQIHNRLSGQLATLGFIAALVAAASSACGSTNSSPPFDTGTGDDASTGGGDDGSGGNCFGVNCQVMGDDGSAGGVGGFGDGGFPEGSVTTGPGGVVTVDTCPAPLTAAQATALKAGGGSPDSSMKWLYPYDGTVFPGGILPPVLQWAQSSKPDGVLVHLKSSTFDYKGCFAGTSPGQIPLPSAAWNTAFQQNTGSADPITVELSTITGGKVSAPITEKWTFALGSLKGAVYYNTYNSQLTTPADGAVMKIGPGDSKPSLLLTVAGGTVPLGPCISCHSLSADGSMIVAQRHFYPGGLQAPGSMSFSLAGGVTVTPTSTPTASTMNDDWGFSAVYPDGSLLLTCGEPGDTTNGGGASVFFPAGPGGNPGMIGKKTNVMYDTKSGTTISYTGLAVQYAMMPMFSPDGKKIVYNDYDNGQGASLMVQDFNAQTHTFSNPVSIYKDTSGKFPGWPFFTPDSQKVVFALGNSNNFSSIPPTSFSGVGPVQASASDVAASDLYMVQLSSPGKAIALDAANGFKNGSSYLPFPGRDEHLQFYPTVMPVASGGYFWVFFTSRRQYGNLLVDTTNGNAVPDPVFHNETKKIWVAAININPSPGQDPSHPPFELPGQELNSGNIRAFATLNPCKADNSSCEEGVDCCGGSCSAGGEAGANKVCQKPPPGCVQSGNRCVQQSDCCDKTQQCINNYCSSVVQ